MRYLNLSGLCVILLLITACSGNHPGPILKKGEYQGIYKVGNPYKIDGKWYYPEEDTDYDEIGVSSWYGPNFHGKVTANGDIFNQYALTAAHRTLPIPSYVKVTNLENDKTLILLVNDRGPYADNRILDVSKKAARLLGFKEQGLAKVRVQFLAGQTRELLTDLGIGQDSAVFSDPYYRTKPYQATQAPATLVRDMAALSPAAGSTKLEKIHNPFLPPLEVREQQERIRKQNEMNNQAPEVVSGISNESLYYIQVGSFSKSENASKTAYRLLSFGDTKIIPVSINGEKFYRVHVGPADNLDDAKIIMDKLLNIGYKDALVVR
ncbi:MAG: septal ring lytic transglycosylase RlpA family protein [Rickettsiales bacterium]|nr:septal ring lytic transglycosylase RlpA family protein [Rickettsiales bacterium]